MSMSDARTSWQPETYAELGAAVPFTTPQLIGARARCSPRGLELTVPNPAGKGGVYVLAPREISGYCRPTLHDRRLVANMAGFTSITPGEVRQAARAVLGAGFAGRAGAASVRRTRDVQQTAELAMQLGTLRLLVRQTGGAEAAGLDRGARTAMQAFAVKTRHSVETVGQAVETLSRLGEPAGLPGSVDARHPALLNTIETMLAAIADRAGPDAGRAAKAGALIQSVGRDTVALARKALDANWQLLNNIPGLLAAFLQDPAAVGLLLGRLEWLMDGWETVCLIWRTAPPGRTYAVMNEMALAVPCIPAEAGVWYSTAVHESSRHGLRAELLGFSDWRSGGLVHELTARNEAMRALAA